MESRFPPNPGFSPVLTDIAWQIECSDHGHIVCDDDLVMYEFGRQLDAELAIEAMRQNDILNCEQLSAVPDPEFKRIITSLLQW